MSPPFSTVLIANRGEIATRIIQTCRELGIRTIAVYSSVDGDALHVRRADEAYCIGPPSALESYLHQDTILDVAARSGAEAVHPGYGFLAENAEFARRVTEAGLTWIGPPAPVIALLGDKVAAKEIAGKAGVPVVPGYLGSDQTLERIAEEADRIGYPVMLKAAAGGGGKGMRSVQSAQHLPAALDGARREAHSAFGDDRVFLEKLLVNPRHIEIQVLLDGSGGALYLGERECSIQRRHQKVVEESPSPILTPELRARMGDAAVRLARAASYVNAGTVEFLFAGDRFYFLEVNTRIQVEHPVTEMVTGLDLVRLQLEIAAGQSLPLSQNDVVARGHAIEARLYAEDPATSFLPATGRVERFEPPSGPGIRNDVGVGPGMEVTPYYDPILAKLIAHAETRDGAVERLRRALERYTVLGVTTNLGFLHWITEQPDFLAGRTDTGFVDRSWNREEDAPLPEEVLLAAAAYESLSAWKGIDGSGRMDSNPWRSSGGWRVGGAARLYRYRYRGDAHVVTVTREARDSALVRLDGAERAVRFHMEDSGSVVVYRGNDTLSSSCVRTDTGLDVAWNGLVYALERPVSATDRSSDAIGGGRDEATSPMPGTVVKVAVTQGQVVKAREALVILEAMKMEHVVEAPHDGIVLEVLYGEGDMVPAGAPVVRLEER